MRRLLCVVVLVFIGVQASGASEVRGFEKLRTKVVSAIGTAQKHVWLFTSFLSDYDVSLALYVAKFRRVDVRVALERERLGTFLSQHRYLQAHGIPVVVMARIGETVLVYDDKMLRVDSDLDFLTVRDSFTVARVSNPNIGRYAGLMGVRVQGKPYDYTKRRHTKPSYISSKLPKETIHNIKQKFPRRGRS